MKHAFIFILLVYIVRTTVAQQERNTVVMPGLRGHYGFIVPHSSTIRNISWSKPRGFEVDFAWLLMGEEDWRYCFCYPRAGLSFFFVNFGNPEVLGNAWSLYGFIEPLIGAGGKVYGTVRFGIGPSFMDNVYDSVDNPANRFYSSHISFVVLLSAGINYRISDKFNLRLSGSFNHISNGGIKNPNTGINFPTLSLGADYRINPLPFEYRIKDRSLKLVPYKSRLDVSIFGTGKTDIKGNERYPVLGLLTSYTHVVGRISGLTLGMEFVADYADRHEIERTSPVNVTAEADHKYVAALLGHDLLLGRFNFQLQLGAYLYSPFKRMDPVFERYTLTYYPFGSLYTGISLKAHRYVADFLDVRMGYSF